MAFFLEGICEGLNKEFNTSILVSGAVQAAVADGFDFRARGMVHVKGRAAGGDLWELVGGKQA
ncbi:hypothetical protein ACQKGL_14040 [Ensifer adhaerens]|uniref:hypothetical protein n=1 Tax=Ensifer adhaerens TaxID=106592 RepID=UPI003D023671